MYKLNKGAFLNMISSLNIQEGKFTIDFSKINKFKEDGKGTLSTSVHMEESFVGEGGSQSIPDFREDFSIIESSNTDGKGEEDGVVGNNNHQESQFFVSH